jgi:hypothetical protein
MPETKDEKAKPFDPLDSFRGMRDAYLDAMSKTMIEAVNTEGYAQATGAMLDYYLTASAPFREALEKSMLGHCSNSRCHRGKRLLLWRSDSRTWRCGSTTSMPRWTAFSMRSPA